MQTTHGVMGRMTTPLHHENDDVAIIFNFDVLKIIMVQIKNVPCFEHVTHCDK